MTPQGTLHKRYVLLGLGKKGELSSLGAEEAGAKLSVAIEACDGGSVLIDFQGIASEESARLVSGMKLSRYEFKKYKD